MPPVSVAWLAIALLPAVCLLVTCGKVPRPDSPSASYTRTAWEYPIHLGDTRSRVHELLGAPENPALEYKGVFPASGIEVWFGRDDRVTKLSFIGEAAALYRTSDLQIPSARYLMLGLTAHSSEIDFRRALGPPVLEDLAGRPDATERHCAWKTKDLLIDAEFLASDRTEDGKTYGQGTLLWFYVSPAL